MILEIENSCDDRYYFNIRQKSGAPLTALTLGSTQRRAHARIDRAYGTAS